jgi:predicted ATPase/DNA-binding XRE family transcriptional regulator
MPTLGDASGLDFGTALKRLRVAAGFSQEELADRAGVSMQAISAYERGSRKNPYRDTIALLVKALELSPEQRRELERAAARPRRARPLPVEPAREPGPTNLPPRLASFVGRERELDELAALLAQRRMVTITGSGGVGKTSTAIEVALAQRYARADGVWLIELAALSDGTLIAAAIAATLGIRLPADGDHLAVVAKALAAKDTLLLLDNCEHVVRDAAVVAQTLLRACPKLAILATTREALRVSGEAAYHMPSLSQTDAVALFVDRAQEADHRFALGDDNAPLVAEIVRRLDGIPLAIELAAAKIKVFGVAELRNRLDERFRVLIGGNPAALPRQQTLQALIAWSYDLLSGQERILLRRLAIFAGSFTLAAAETVCCGEGLERPAIVEVLASLVEKSLVAVEPAEDSPRYRLLESTRAFALQRLAEIDGKAAGDPEIARLERRRAAWVAAFAGEVYAGSWTSAEPVLLAQILPDIENVRAALRWTLDREPDPETAGRIAGGLTSLWQARGLGEGRRAIERILEGWTDAYDPAVEILLWLGLSATTVAKRKADAAARAVALCERLGERAGLAAALRLQADGLRQMQQLDEADEVALRALALFRELGQYANSHYPALLQTRACILVDRRRNDEARRLFAEALQRFESIGDLRAIANVKLLSAELEFADGNATAAIALAEQTIEAFATLGDFVGQAGTSCNAAAYYLAANQIENARTAARQALDFGLLVDISLYVTLALQHLGTVAALNGNPRRGALLLAHGDRWLRTEGFEREFTEQTAYDRGLGAVRAALSEEEAARIEAAAARITEEEAIAEARLA